MEFLPDEVIEYILEDCNVRMHDVAKLSLTCKQMYRIVNASNKLWRTKFFQRWPFLKEAYDANSKVGRKVNWKDECHASVEVRRKLAQQLSQMSAKYYKKQELAQSELRDFDVLLSTEEKTHPMVYHHIIDELTKIIECPVHLSNLTHAYYAVKVIRHLKQDYLAKEWEKFSHLPAREQTLERGAMLVAQWSQPEKRVSYSHVSSMLDDIAEQTKEALLEKNPAHPIFSTPSEQLDLWRRCNIDDHQWSTAEARQIMRVLGEVMFDKLGFKGNSEMYYSSENLFIDQVLDRKHGVPVTLAIVLESVARRLGVRCEPVSFPSHFLLRWKESYKDPESRDSEDFYIDVFNSGRFITKLNCPQVGRAAQCPIESYNVHSAATTKEVVERIGRNLEIAGRQRTRLNGRAARLRSALELLHMLRQTNTSILLQLARFYMLHQMDLTDLVTRLTEISEMQKAEAVGQRSRGQASHILRMLLDYQKHMKVVPEEETEVKERSPEVKYAVGMIMRHSTYDFVCVITGWDRRYEATMDWMNDMSVHELSNGPNQPFYNVFAEDGSSHYAAQKNLQMDPSPDRVNHDEIGRYFSHFKGTHYVPNEEKAREYPQDSEVRDRLLALYS